MFNPYKQELNLGNEGTEMKQTSELKEKRVWNFQYKGIHCEVVNWGFKEPWDGHPSGVWNGYITILRKQVPDEFEKLLCKKEKTKFSSRPFMWKYWGLDRVFDMKGGLTYYEVIRDEFSGNIIAIKVGNDYVHSWDVGMSYDVEDVIRDLKNSVDTFIKHYPYYLVRNPKNGSYVKPSDLSQPNTKEDK